MFMKRLIHFFVKFSLVLMIFFSGLIAVLSVACVSFYKGRFLDSIPVFVGVLAVIFAGIFLVLLFHYVYCFLQVRRRYVSVGLFLSIVILQIFFLVFVSHPMGISDAAEVQHEALAMVLRQHGKLNMENSYFQQYTNNHFILIVFYYFYRFLRFLNIGEVWLPNILLNMALIDLSIYLTYRLGRRLRGEGFARFVLFLYLISPVTYTWLTTAYTNTFSMPFVIGILYLSLAVRKKRLSVKSVLICIFLGVTLAVGYLLRATTVLPAIAMVIFSGIQFMTSARKIWEERREEPVREAVLEVDETEGKEQGKEGQKEQLEKQERPEISEKPERSEKTDETPGWKITLAKMGIVAMVSMVTWLGCRQLMNQHIDQDRLTGNFPVMHWIMMGMNQESGGGYSVSDVLYTRSFSTLEERKKADTEELLRRVRKMGVLGTGRQLLVKVGRVWGLADDDALKKNSYAKDFPVLYEYVMGYGSGWFVIYMQALRMAIFLYILCSSVFAIRQKEWDEIFMEILTLLGAILFFMLMEANLKYNICFTGICLLITADGVERTGGYVKKPFRAVMVFSLCAAIGLFFPVLKKGWRPEIRNYYKARIPSDSVPMDKAKDIPKNLRTIEQTIRVSPFEKTEAWNEICLYFSAVHGEVKKNEYTLKVISESDNRVLYHADLGAEDLPEEKRKKTVRGKMDMERAERLAYTCMIPLQGKRKKTDTSYRIELVHHGKRYSMLPLISKHSEFDVYPAGALFLDGKPTLHDLTMYLYARE